MEKFSIPNKTILVTGANGQLGSELQQLVAKYPYRFLFTTKENLPIENFEGIIKYFENHPVDFCINCAAYTAVDKAEAESEKAFLINGTAVGNLAQVCNQYQVKFIHISTDYVFNGNFRVPYKEGNTIDPINIYGASKLKGEELTFSYDPSALVIRTSWVYSSFGNNFVKTMKRLMSEKESINVINDQHGCPTYAADLADVILKITQLENPLHGIINYCNKGITTWYDFALAIKELIKSDCIVNPIPASQYNTAAKRPQYSVLDTSKILQVPGIIIPHWKKSLQKCLALLN